MNRWLVLVKWLLVIPGDVLRITRHRRVWFCAPHRFFQVLFTGKWNEGMQGCVDDFMRWTTVRRLVLHPAQTPGRVLDRGRRSNGGTCTPTR